MTQPVGFPRSGWDDGITGLGCVAGLPTVVKLVDRETLMKEREEKKKVRKLVAEA